LGDILVTPEQAEALADSRAIAFGNPWTQASVYYEFNANVTAVRRTLARASMAQWSNDTAIRLIESAVAANRILISDDPGNIGCGSSFLGMVGGVQDLLIRCWQTSTIVHEFGHALGASHEHQRSDRGAFVAIVDVHSLQVTHPAVWNANYAIQAGGSINSAYDYASVMHYPQAGSFTINMQTYQVNISALGPQSAGAPAGSAGACLSAPQCTALLGQANASARDLHGTALRYGRRLTRLESYRPVSGTLSVSGHIDECGPDCWRVPAQSAVTVTLTTAPGKIAVLSGPDCDIRGAGSVSCVLPTDRNRGFIALEFAAQALPWLESEPRAENLFASGFE
jgi:hypothetical protein